MDSEHVVAEAVKLRAQTLRDPLLAPDIDPINTRIPAPFCGDGYIRLFVIGQDPTVKNEKSRSRIKVALNLDRPGSLRNYLGKICGFLRIELERNVYATNLLKCFFKNPPASQPGPIERHKNHWLPLLRSELACYPKAVVITLGEPLLEALVKEGPRKVRTYWGYMGKSNEADAKAFSAVKAENNILKRELFPFPHQPSLRKVFYSRWLSSYLQFVRRHLGQDCQ